MTGRSGPCPASFAPNGPSGSSVSTRNVWISGVSRVVGLLYSRSDGFLCTPLRKIWPSMSPTTLETRRILVHALAEDLAFHERLADAHVHRALDLTLGEQRVQRATEIVSDPDVVEFDLSGLFVNAQLDDTRGIGIAGRRADTPALVLPRPLRRRVRAGERDHAVRRLGELDRLGEGHRPLPVGGDAYLAL